MYLGESQSRTTLPSWRRGHKRNPAASGGSGRRPADALPDRLDQIELQQEAVELVRTAQGPRHGLSDLPGVTHLQPFVAIFDLLNDRSDIPALTPGIDLAGGAGQNEANETPDHDVGQHKREKDEDVGKHAASSPW